MAHDVFICHAHRDRTVANAVCATLNNRGLFYMRKGEYEKALADFNEALKLDPKYVLGYRNRAALYERMGDRERAAQNRNKTKELDPEGLVRGF